MMDVIHFCQKCGSSDGAYYSGPEHRVLCARHWIEYDLEQKISAYRTRRQWVKNVWFADLLKRRREIEDLRKLLLKMEEEA